MRLVRNSLRSWTTRFHPSTIHRYLSTLTSGSGLAERGWGEAQPQHWFAQKALRLGFATAALRFGCEAAALCYWTGTFANLVTGPFTRGLIGVILGVAIQSSAHLTGVVSTQ